MRQCFFLAQGIPLATCTALVLASRYGQQAPFIYDRKEEKDHGEGGSLVGACELLFNTQAGGTSHGAAPRVLVVDDVLTSGTALKSGINKIRSVAPNTELVALVILLDRQEKQDGKSGEPWCRISGLVLACNDCLVQSGPRLYQILGTTLAYS